MDNIRLRLFIVSILDGVANLGMNQPLYFCNVWLCLYKCNDFVHVKKMYIRKEDQINNE